MSTTWKLLKDKKTGKPTGDIITPVCRGAYLALFEPRGIKNQPDSEKKYSLAMLFPKGTDFAPLKELIKQVAVDKWASKADDVLRKQQNSDKRIFKDAGEKSEVAGFEEGCIYLQSANKSQPGLVGKKAGPDGTLIALTDEDSVWSGDYFLVQIRPFAWEHPVGGKGVSLSLQNVQLWQKGERLGGGRVRVSDAFEAYDDEDDAALDQGAAPAAGGKDPFA